MVEVGLSELQADLSSLVETARRGETVIILDNGKPVARLMPPQGDELQPWDARRQTFAERVADVRTRFAGDAPPMTEEEFQAEIDAVRGRS